MVFRSLLTIVAAGFLACIVCTAAPPPQLSAREAARLADREFRRIWQQPDLRHFRRSRVVYRKVRDSWRVRYTDTRGGPILELELHDKTRKAELTVFDRW